MKILTKYTICITEGYQDGYTSYKTHHRMVVIANNKEEAIEKAKSRIIKKYNNDYLCVKILFSEDIIVNE